MISIYQPTSADALGLLNAANLPTADLTEAHFNYFWAATDGRLPVGIVGLEPFAPYGLLRSLVVSPARRNQGIGTHLVKHVETMAHQLNISELYLLTVTAQEFFEEFDFQPISRDSAPAAIRKTWEFSGLCPVSSLLMKKNLRKNK
ncbi:MAG: arsenic resistance N-acetyltransferase ArsN2 [Cellvibrionaceae bacterium]|nr:arsenic resistance N-acetyltransferase ArsN2 [Cellvibrionaceae bacterium]